MSRGRDRWRCLTDFSFLSRAKEGKEEEPVYGGRGYLEKGVEPDKKGKQTCVDCLKKVFDRFSGLLHRRGAVEQGKEGGPGGP